MGLAPQVHAFQIRSRLPDAAQGRNSQRLEQLKRGLTAPGNLMFTVDVMRTPQQEQLFITFWRCLQGTLISVERAGTG